jgi:hypothetical protein
VNPLFFEWLETLKKGDYVQVYRYIAPAHLRFLGKPYITFAASGEMVKILHVFETGDGGRKFVIEVCGSSEMDGKSLSIDMSCFTLSYSRKLNALIDTITDGLMLLRGLRNGSLHGIY